jgi:chaperonin cofactor prefoldin
VENNVHKEISAIKSIAETLLKSSDMKNQQNDDAKLTPVEKRVATLENCMERILDRLDSISTNITTGNRNHAPSHHA